MDERSKDALFGGDRGHIIQFLLSFGVAEEFWQIQHTVNKSKNSTK